MTQACHRVFRSLSDLLHVIFMQLAVNSPEGHVYLTEDPQRLHSFFYRMKREFGKDFPELGEVHFGIGGAFPYSWDLSNSLWTLFASEAFSKVGSCMLLRRKHDTQEILEIMLNEALSTERERERFHELISRFDEITEKA